MTSKKSNLKAMTLSAIAAGCALAGAAALAQPMEVVTVEAVREIIIGMTPTGVPIKEITVRSKVSYADLDLKTDAGAAALEKRIRDTATSTCNDINKMDLDAQGSSVDKCIKHAIDGAMGQAQKVIAMKRGTTTK